jgi:hypothetical protein
MMMKLSPARRVLLLVALVILFMGNIRVDRKDFHFDTNGILFWAGAILLVLLALEVADRVTMKRDLEIAREIQSWLMPSAPPKVAGVDVAFATRPANTVAGDYYDAFLRSDTSSSRVSKTDHRIEACCALCGQKSGKQADGCHTTVAHNTLSGDATHVQVFYPFHPLHGYRLRVLRRPKQGDGAVLVMDAAGKRLKIPVWMLSPAAANIKTTQQALLSREALLSLTSLLSQRKITGKHDNLLQTSVDRCKGGHHAAAATLKPDRNRRGIRSPRCDGQSRTGRSHGAHSSGGFSNGSKEDK